MIIIYTDEISQYSILTQNDQKTLISPDTCLIGIHQLSCQLHACVERRWGLQAYNTGKVIRSKLIFNRCAYCCGYDKHTWH